MNLIQFLLYYNNELVFLRRFASDVAASKEEQEQRMLYTRILEYEQDMVSPII